MDWQSKHFIFLKSISTGIIIWTMYQNYPYYEVMIPRSGMLDLIQVNTSSKCGKSKMKLCISQSGQGLRIFEKECLGVIRLKQKSLHSIPALTLGFFFFSNLRLKTFSSENNRGKKYIFQHSLGNSFVRVIICFSSLKYVIHLKCLAKI